MAKKKSLPQGQVHVLRRARLEVLEALDDHRYSGPIGELFLLGIVDEVQVEAARRFTSLVRRYSNAIDASFVPAKVAAMERQYGQRHQNDLDHMPAGERTPEEQAELEKAAKALKADYLRVVGCLREAGHGCLREVTMVCLYAEPVNSLLTLVSGLDAMVALFGLEGEIRQPSARG